MKLLEACAAATRRGLPYARHHQSGLRACGDRRSKGWSRRAARSLGSCWRTIAAPP